MISVFIVRPFGTKQVTVKDKDGKDDPVEVDFGETDRLLIKPALERNGLIGQTTGVIAEAGNIRFDMFQMLIASDMVIADMSVHNANVFYELGIRHGLRPNGTILIRFEAGGDVPFDLKTDRYIPYKRENPAAAVDDLARSIKDTLITMQRQKRQPDSPVFLLLPELVAPNRSKLIVVPEEFQQAVEQAEKQAKTGRTTLALLAEEAKQTPWRREGVRWVARAQRRIKHLPAARDSWEYIRKELPDDAEANLQLATIYHRLGELVLSSQACQRVLDNPATDRKSRADALSQLGRSEKSLWVADFSDVSDEKERRGRAISNALLIAAFDGYREGFAEDLNTYYSGLNALGLLTIIVNLAETESEAWINNYPTEKRAAAALDDYREQLAHLRGAVRLSLDAAEQRVRLTGKADDWLAPSQAQFALLTTDKPKYVKTTYSAARTSPGFSVDSEAAQVEIFHALGLLRDNAAAALAALGVASSPVAAAAAALECVIVGTGHRADAKGRPSPRFPNTPECIDKVKDWLRGRIVAEKAASAASTTGVAGAASGFDLLFHEICAELGVPTKVVLPIPKADYQLQSVSDGGPEWVERFQRLVAANPPIVLSDSADLPVWAASIANYGVFNRANIWMMKDALLRPDVNVTLLALWDGKAGDGPGGTKDMVDLANRHGAKVRVKDSGELFGLSP